MNKFATRLIELREDKNLSQNELAKALGISSITISRWERGIRIPNVDSAIVLSNFFNVTVGYMVGAEN